MSYALPGEAVLVLDQAGSTNDEAFARLEGRERLLVWTTNQTAGRGSRGRGWLSPPGVGLALSLGLCCPPAPHPADCCYPLFAAVWVHRALSELWPEAEFRLKWPNDVLFQGRKLAGILCESRLVGQQARVVIGVGINLRDDQALAALGRPYATVAELARAHAPAALVESLRAAAGPELERLAAEGHVTAWLARSGLRLGQGLRLIERGQTREGRFEGLAPTGELRLGLADGSVELISQAVEDCLILPVDRVADRTT